MEQPSIANGRISIPADVQERKFLLEKLAESEERYATAVNASNLGLWDFDVLNSQIVAAGKIAEIHGLTSNDECTPEQLLRSIHPEDLPGQQKLFNDIVEGKVNVIETEYRIVQKNSANVRWISVKGSAFFKEEGKLYRMAGTVADITSKKAAEAALEKTNADLRKQKRIYEAVTRTTPDLIYVFDLDYRFSYANDALLAMWGQTFENAIGKGLRELGYEEWHAAMHEREIDQVVATKKPIRGTVSFPHAELGKRIYDYIFTPVINDRGEVEAVAGTTRDISDIKSAEETLRVSEQRFRSILEQAPDPILILKGENMVLEAANEPLFNIWNVKRDAIGKGFLEILPEMRGQGFFEMLQDVYFNDKIIKGIETPAVFTRPDGTKETVYFNFIYQPYRQADETISGVMVLANDVTQQVVAKQQLQESEEQFRNFSNNIQNLAWIADGEGWIFWYNQRWYDYTGTTLQEMQGWGWEKVHHPDHIERVVNFVKEAWKRAEPWELTFPLKGADGGYSWFLTRAVPIKDKAGKTYRWIGTNTNINDQKLAEEAVKESESRFRALAETLPQMIWVTDDKGRSEYFSGQWREYAGVDGSVQAWEDIIHPEDKKASETMHTEAFTNGIPFNSEVRLKNKEGEYRWHRTFAEPVDDGQGKIIKWVGALTDIHDRKTQAERLKRLVDERTVELQRSNEDLQHFAHVASHDLKEPVRKVRTFGNRLKEEFAATLPERAKTFLSKIESATDRMYSMIDGVLMYSSLNAVQQTTEKVDLNDLFQEIQTDLEVVIQERKAMIEYDTLPVVEGSPVLLYQLFYNLINNSLKFAKTNVAPHISIRKEKENNYVRIKVKDNGIGFDQSYAAKIFETFSRLHPKDKYEGTGLGLALCKKIVERHGGTIEAHGKEGEGATFVITLPLMSNND